MRYSILSEQRYRASTPMTNLAWIEIYILSSRPGRLEIANTVSREMTKRSISTGKHSHKGRKTFSGMAKRLP